MPGSSARRNNGNSPLHLLLTIHPQALLSTLLATVYNSQACKIFARRQVWGVEEKSEASGCTGSIRETQIGRTGSGDRRGESPLTQVTLRRGRTGFISGCTGFIRGTQVTLIMEEKSQTRGC